MKIKRKQKKKTEHTSAKIRLIIILCKPVANVTGRLASLWLTIEELK